MTKRCSVCGEEKDESEFGRRKDRGTLRSECRTCKNKKGAASRLKDRIARDQLLEKDEQLEPGKRRCRFCKEIKNEDDFTKGKRTRTCKKCRNERDKVNRRTAEYRERKAKARRRGRKLYPEKERAKWKVLRAVKQGILEKRPCEVCGGWPVIGHHPDYSEPLAVEWLCPLHHVREHQNETTEELRRAKVKDLLSRIKRRDGREDCPEGRAREHEQVSDNREVATDWYGRRGKRMPWKQRRGDGIKRRTFGHSLDIHVEAVIKRIAKDEGRSKSAVLEQLLKEALTARIQGFVPNGEWEGPSPEDFDGGEP